MLDVLKEMQKHGIFKLAPNDDLDAVITRAVADSDIVSAYDPIQKYIKKLVADLQYRHGVKLGTHLSDFSDKFFYEMFNMSFTCTNHSNGIYQKEMEYGKAGLFSFGIDMTTSTFTLDERKLLKLINHYFISLSNQDSFKDGFVFIPISTLKCIYPNVNNIKLKEKIIRTCSRLNTKVIYWDLSKTRYNKELASLNLNTGKKEHLADISILYHPHRNKNGSDGVATKIDGIICKINRFMKLRKNLEQISNLFPISALKSNYLEFEIAEMIDYRLHMLKFNSNSKRKNNKSVRFKKNLRDLADEIHLYVDDKPQRDTYLIRIMDGNPQEAITTLIAAIINVLNIFSTSYNLSAMFKCSTCGNVILDDYLPVFRKISSIDNKPKANKMMKEELKKIYISLSKSVVNASKTFKVKELINNGRIELIIDLN